MTEEMEGPFDEVDDGPKGAVGTCTEVPEEHGGENEGKKSEELDEEKKHEESSTLTNDFMMEEGQALQQEQEPNGQQPTIADQPDDPILKLKATTIPMPQIQRDQFVFKCDPFVEEEKSTKDDDHNNNNNNNNQENEEPKKEEPATMTKTKEAEHPMKEEETSTSTTLEEPKNLASSKEKPSNVTDVPFQQDQCEPLVEEEALTRDDLHDLASLAEKFEKLSMQTSEEKPIYDEISAQVELELPMATETRALEEKKEDFLTETPAEEESSAPPGTIGEKKEEDFLTAEEGNTAAIIDDADSLPSIEALTLKGVTLVPDQVAPIFRKHGIVALQNTMMTELDECNSQAKQALAALVEEQLEPRGLELDGVEPFDLWDARRVKGRRIENQHSMLEDPDSPIARLSRRLQQELPLLLFGRDEDDFKLERAGVWHCFPRKKQDPLPGNETWRRDGSSLFGDNHHDAYSFNVLIPLSDVRGSSGIFEFIPGSHVECLYEKIAPEFEQLAEHDMALRSDFPAGTIVILDNRILHRGITNSSNEMQQLIYFNFTKNWFHEQKPNYFVMNKSSMEALAVHSQLLLMSRLYQLVTNTSSTHLVSVNDSYGYKFFTDRFDLLLLEGLLSHVDELKASATANIAAVLHFCRLSDGDKETMTRQFVYSFSERAYERKARVLQKTTRKKRQKLGEKTVNDDAISVTIDPDSHDAAVLCDLTSSILMEESTLISKLGFTANEMGIACLLAMLKCHAARNSLGCIGVSPARLDEVFGLWWYARHGRFSFLPGHATSDDERASRRVVVVFIDLNAGKPATQWISSIRDACGDCCIDILLALDPVFSCFCQSPKGDWKGADYFHSEIEARISGYRSVMFLGDSFGASAALRFSSITDRVLAFAPRVDISNCNELKRSDFPGAAKIDFQENLVCAVGATEAKVSVHYSNLCKGQREDVELLSMVEGIELIEHDSTDIDLRANLETSGELMPLLESAIKGFAKPTPLAQ